MMEKHYEHNQELHMLFMDFKQAFDITDKYKLYRVMGDMKIPYKLIRLVKMTTKKTTTRVKVTNKLSNNFTFNAGVRQGDGLSTTLFILALHYGVQKIDQRSTIFTKLSQICAYADDIVIVARKQKKLTEVNRDLEEETSKLGTEINKNKTKYMVTSTYEYRRNVWDLRIGNKTFEAVQSFQYLRNIIGNTNNNNNKCIKDRIMMGNKAYYANRQLVNSSLVSRNSKLQIYRSGHLWFRIMDTHHGREKSISSI
jgi:sorting nexin-29